MEAPKHWTYEDVEEVNRRLEDAERLGLHHGFMWGLLWGFTLGVMGVIGSQMIWRIL